MGHGNIWVPHRKNVFCHSCMIGSITTTILKTETKRNRLSITTNSTLRRIFVLNGSLRKWRDFLKEK